MLTRDSWRLRCWRWRLRAAAGGVGAAAKPCPSKPAQVAHRVDMSLQRVVRPSSVLLGIFLCQIYFQTAMGQVRPRVVEAVDDARRTSLSGNVHPLARAEFARGAVGDSQPMNRILLLLKRSDEQEAALQDALAKQQDKSSPTFHQWLT